MSELPGIVDLRKLLGSLDWVTDLLVAGSAATGDYTPGISDLDLVALTAGPVDRARQGLLKGMRQALDSGVAQGLKLGCAYVSEQMLADRKALHPTWTHGGMVDRKLSGITRAELVRHGYAVSGRPPQMVLPPVSKNDVRRAARAELTGYWAGAVARPWEWLDPVVVDLGLTTMARGRRALDTGELLSKTGAIEMVNAPPWLVDQLRARRQGEHVTSPRLLSAWHAWRDARLTVEIARRWKVN